MRFNGIMAVEGHNSDVKIIPNHSFKKSLSLCNTLFNNIFKIITPGFP